MYSEIGGCSRVCRRSVAVQEGCIGPRVTSLMAGAWKQVDRRLHGLFQHLVFVCGSTRVVRLLSIADVSGGAAREIRLGEGVHRRGDR